MSECRYSDTSQCMINAGRIMKFDHYAEARRLSKSLVNEGMSQWAHQIMEAMAIGATGTEIFMHLRSVLRQMISTENLSPESYAVARRLIEEINNSLS